MSRVKLQHPDSGEIVLATPESVDVLRAKGYTDVEHETEPPAANGTARDVLHWVEHHLGAE